MTAGRGWVPANALSWREIRHGQWRREVFAGATVAAYAVPQVMAYAQLAGLPAVAGVWALVVAAIAYALLGSSAVLSVGPESTTALLTAVAIAPLVGGDPGRAVVLAATCAGIVAVLSLIAALLRLGFLAELLSKPVLVGYLAGVAVLMVVSQLSKITGAPVVGDSPLGEIGDLIGRVSQVQWPTLVMAVVSLVALLGLAKFLPVVPGPLVVVLFATVVTAAFSLQYRGIAVVGQLVTGLPSVSVPMVGLDDLQVLAPAAAGIALVAFTDNVLTARAFAGPQAVAVDARAELLALAGANAGAALVQGFPVSSSGSRTALAVGAGGRTPAQAVIAAAIAAAIVLVAPGVLSSFPTAVLGALVVYAALRLLDARALVRLWSLRPAEAALAVAATVGVISLGILPGVVVAVGLSIADLLRRVARPHDAILGSVPGLAGLHDVDDYPTAVTVPGLVIYRYDSPLFFANAADFRRRALDAVDESALRDGTVTWLLLNAEAFVEVDSTGLEALEQVRSNLADRGVALGLVRVKRELYDDLVRVGMISRIGDDHVFPTLPTAIAAFRAAFPGPPKDPA